MRRHLDAVIGIQALGLRFSRFFWITLSTAGHLAINTARIISIYIYIHILGIRKFRISNQENSGLKSDTANLKIISHQASKHRKRTLHNNS